MMKAELKAASFTARDSLLTNGGVERAFDWYGQDFDAVPGRCIKMPNGKL
ncbi:hypothetical protein [Bradyrhizobium manausense]|nr:hypothetical protein [Bradyrhizobium manausense]